jgi:hypothetical protein
MCSPRTQELVDSYKESIKTGFDIEKYKTIDENKVLINPPQNKNIDNLLIDVQGGIIRSIERLILRTPNDMELGKAVREIFSPKKE